MRTGFLRLVVEPNVPPVSRCPRYVVGHATKSLLSRMKAPRHYGRRCLPQETSHYIWHLLQPGKFVLVALILLAATDSVRALSCPKNRPTGLLQRTPYTRFRSLLITFFRCMSAAVSPCSRHTMENSTTGSSPINGRKITQLRRCFPADDGTNATPTCAATNAMEALFEDASWTILGELPAMSKHAIIRS